MSKKNTGIRHFLKTTRYNVKKNMGIRHFLKTRYIVEIKDNRKHLRRQHQILDGLNTGRGNEGCSRCRRMEKDDQNENERPKTTGQIGR